jgi:hypothetical protein
MIKRALLFLIAFALAISYAQYYDIAIVRANDSAVQDLVYDDPSFSYKDNSMENPDADLRVCALTAADLQNRYIALAYADGSDGDYIILTHFPAHVTSVPPSLCVQVPLEISSFRAWYPSVPYVFISNSPVDFSGASRWKLSTIRGWLIGNYTVNSTQAGNLVNITVTDALDDGGASIIPDVNYLVIGLVRDDFTTMDTAISSINDPVLLTADSPTAPYRIFINGIGPDIPPYVEIITPQPITYETGTIPFTYIMYDDDDITACWYVLDGVTVNMPVCGPSYILSVGQGPHTLTLYANDTTGNTGSDSVSFTVGAVAPPGPPGGGPPGTPFYPYVPPPPPPLEYFSIIPENIYVIIDYPEKGVEDFQITSTVPLGNVNCFVRGDFENYTTVEVGKVIPANGTISGTITVDMSPTEILDYDKGTEGVMQCVGETEEPSLLSSTVANVYLIIHRPLFTVENTTIDVFLEGEEVEGIIAFNNTGDYNSTAINITGEFKGAYSRLVEIRDITRQLKYNERGYVEFTVRVPYDFEPGSYTIPLDLYENGRFMGGGYLYLNVIAGPPPPPVCIPPDLWWTILILIIGMIVSTYVFRRKARELEEKMPRIPKRKTLEYYWKYYRRPIVYAAFTMLVFVIIWAIVVLMFAKCQ